MSKANIVWIYCDELRADALSCYGNAHFQPRTPYLDWLAEMGVRFDRCYCNSPVCVPSRTSVLTGLYPEDTGVYHNEAAWPNYRLLCSPVTLPQVFAENGYATANFGKVHIPHEMEPWQVSDTDGGGMREYYAVATEEELAFFRPPGIPTVIGGHFPGDRPYPAEQVTQNALRYMAEAEEPYFVRLSYLQPHTPVLPRPPYDRMYMEEAFPDTVSVPGTLSQFEARFGEVIGSRQMPREQVFLAQAYYYGLVSWIDEQVGVLLNSLRERGELENTIVIFGADHGCSLGEAGRYQKQTFTRAAQRVPRLIAWPGTIDGGQVRNDISESLDLGKTLCAMVGIEDPAQFKGRDLFSDPAPEAVYSTIGFGFASSRAFPNLGAGTYSGEQGWPRRACVRTDRYRLDKNIRLDGQPVRAEQEDICLIDMQTDLEENVNLAGAPGYAELVERLSAMIDAHVVEHLEVPETHVLRDDRVERVMRAYAQGARDVQALVKATGLGRQEVERLIEQFVKKG